MSKIQPPRLAKRLLSWRAGSLAEDWQGDLDEAFEKNVSRMPVRHAKWIYWRGTFSLLFSYALRSRKKRAAAHAWSDATLSFPMLRNYFLTATRNLARHRFFTILNVLGLAFGMSISLLFIAMGASIFKYDTFHEKRDRIYRVVSHIDNLNGSDDLAVVPGILYSRVAGDAIQVEKWVQISRDFDGVATWQDRIAELRGYRVDKTFFDVFSFPWIKGDPATAFDNPKSVVITEEAGLKMFGMEDPLGKVVSFGALGEFEVTGILATPPKHSHLRFDVLAPYVDYQGGSIPESEAWQSFDNSYLYLLMKDGSTAENLSPYLERLENNYKDSDLKAKFELQALNDIVPGPPYHRELGLSWDYASLSIFLILMLLILLPACFNYANISIARALRRMKEIGLRKVMGGGAGQIFAQFIMETVIISLLALALSYYLFTLIRQEFLNMLVEGPGLSLTPDFMTIVYFLLFALFVALVAGAIPAMHFARLNPVEALKSKPTGRRTFSGRKVMLVFQFTLSLGFIMSVMIAFSQYRETMRFNFGFRQENILDVRLQNADPKLLRNEFTRLASVQSLSMASDIVGTGALPVEWMRKGSETDSSEVNVLSIDENYLDNLDLRLAAGRNFTTSSVGREVIVNETWVKNHAGGEPSDALGMEIMLDKMVTVKGVVKDFHYAPLSESIGNLVMVYEPAEFRYANLRVKSDDIFAMLARIETVWKTIGGEEKFEARFFDDELEEAYSFHFSLIKICGFLGLLAISISCLGMLGMVAFNVENRVKEIGIRKVMGATSTSLTLLLSNEFIRLMLWATPIAVPLTYLFFDNVYLSRQAYKIPIGWFEIVSSLAILFVLGLAAVLSQTLRAAQSNPVDVLRTE